jgi:hypothetical protein
MLHLAIWTRPPVVQGFSLSDFWAWLRYGRAVDAAIDLRLVESWSTIDAHQKTLLSDEFGVGFSTFLFVERLGFQFYADTHFVVDVLAPGYFRLGRRKKVGPAKSPDYIAIDSSGQWHVLECKGTQTSHSVLENAIAAGVAQKANISAVGGITLTHSLVVGLFIPQSASRQSAQLVVRDPAPSAPIAILANVGPDEIRAAVVQIALAKHFAAMGLEEHARYFSTTPRGKLGKLGERDAGRVNEMQRGKGKGDIVFEVAAGNARRFGRRSNKDYRRFRIVFPEALYRELQNAPDVDKFVSALSTRTLHVGWKTRKSAAGTAVVSPMGLTFLLT